MNVNDTPVLWWSSYGAVGNLHEETTIPRYSGVVARTLDFDIIHAHDWLTFPCGIHARGKWKTTVASYACHRLQAGAATSTLLSSPSKKDGMDTSTASCVSDLTRRLLSSTGIWDPRKVFTVHNADVSAQKELQDIPRPTHTGRIVTFLRRITMRRPENTL